MGQTNVKNLGNGGTMDGDVTITGDLTVSGGISLSLNEVLQGTSTIDINSTEALLVRKDGDGGDVFIVDTTNSRVGIGGSPSRRLESINTNAGADTLLLQLRNNSTDTNTSSSLRFVNSTSGTSSAGGAEISAIRNANDGGSLTIKTAQDSSATLTTALTIDSSQKVGIGHSAPATTMHVVSGTGITVSDTATDNTNPTTADGTTDKHLTIQRSAIRSHAPTNANSNLNIGMKGGNDSGAGAIIFQTGNTETERMRIQKNGNLGIGTSSFWAGETTAHTEISATKAGDYTGLILRNENTDAGDSVSLNFGLARDGGLNFGNAGKILVGKEADFTTTPSTVDSFMAFHTILNETSSEKMRLTSGGLLGIGISDPDAYLSGANNLVIGGTSGNHGLTIRSASDSGGFIAFGDGDASSDAGYRGQIKYLHSSDSFVFVTSASNRMILDANSRISLSNNDSGTSNTVFGYQAGNLIGSGDNYNVFIGHQVADADMTNAIQNVGIGYQSLTSLTEGDSNTAVGSGSLYNLTTGNYNVAMGHLSSDAITTAQYSVAIGYGSLGAEVTRGTSVAIGYEALALQTHASDAANSENVGIGFQAGLRNVTGKSNTAVGFEALKGTSSQSGSNITAIGSKSLLVAYGQGNTALGQRSGVALTSGVRNVLIGVDAGATATTSSNMVLIGTFAGDAINSTGADGTVAIGRDSLSALTNGASNVAVGYQTGDGLTDGGNNVLIGHNANSAGGASASQNVGIGVNALLNAEGSNNVAIGYASGESLTSGSNNTIVGRLTADALTTGSSNIVIGDSALGTATTATLNVAIGGDCMSLVPASVAIQDVVAIGQNAFKGASGTDTGANGTVAIGRDSLKALTSGGKNVALGYLSGSQITTGDSNVALGHQAMDELVDGDRNIAIGHNAMGNVVGGTTSDGSSDNIFIGYQSGGGAWTDNVCSQNIGIGSYALDGALDSADYNTTIGAYGLSNVSSGSNNTSLGRESGTTITTGSNNTCIGYDSEPSANSASNQTVIGASATGQADNSVTLGNGDVTAVYMAQDKGATIYASGATFEGGASQTTIDLKATANNYIVGLSNSSGRIDLRPGGTTALTAINNGNVSVTGALSKGSGSFKIDHPLQSKKDTHHLVHSFVEAPQADNIYRGSATLSSGSVEINLDTVSGMSEGTFVLLNTDIQCFTSNESDWDAVKGSVSGNILTISCQNTDSTANVSWLVIGERQDDHMKETDWTDENGKVIVEPEKPEE